MGKAPWGVCSEGLPVRVVRRRATLPHPVGCSTIAVPGLSFRVRKGTGRHTWAMATAKTTTDGPDPQNRDPDRPRGKTTHAPPPARAVTVREPDSGRGYVDVSSCGQTMLIAVWCRLQEEDAVQPPGVGMLVLPFVR